MKEYPADYLDTINLIAIERKSGVSLARTKPDQLLFIGSKKQIDLALHLIVRNTSVNMHDLHERLPQQPSVVEVDEMMNSSQLLPGCLNPKRIKDGRTPPLPDNVKMPSTDHSATTLIGGTGVMNKGWNASMDTARYPVKSESENSKSNIYHHMVKLGYKAEEVDAALRKFGENATMDKVLNSLVLQKDSSDPRILSSFNDGHEPVEDDDDHYDDDDSSSNLKAIMIDGSNIAMR